MQIRVFRALGSFVLTSSLLLAASGTQICGTHRGAAQQSLHLHRIARQSRLMDIAAKGLLFAEQPLDRDAGNIAVLDGSDGIYLERNPFSLDSRTIRVRPAANGAYAMTLADAGIPSVPASMPLNLADDDAAAVDLPFAFPFYTGVYDRIYVHSDGNITFFQSDFTPTPRDVGRLHAGPARIAPLFADLDPSRAPGSVSVAATAGRVEINWINVPLYSDFGAGAPQTFRVVLFPDGSFEMTWFQVTASSSVVGVSPGYLNYPLEVKTLAESDGLVFSGTVAEPFQFGTGIDIVRVAQRFYETHADVYDYLVVFNTTGTPAAPGALAQMTPVRGLVHGIGDTLTNVGWAYGSSTRLQAFLNMGPLAQYPADPRAPVGTRGRITGDNTLTLLGHEAGHLYLALASVRDPANPSRRPMLGAGLAHWSFNFNSDASLLEGNRIEPDAPGAGLFTTTATVQGYSALDQYLMGFRAPWEVPPTFLVDSSSQSATRLPEVGVRIAGMRRDITVDDVIAAEGRRVPDHEIAQRRYSFAFILVTAPGQEPTADQIAQVERYRRDFEAYFHRASGERAHADTRLRNSLRLSAWPATGVVAGESATAIVEVAAGVERDLVVGIHTTHGHIDAPREVTIPRGMRSVAFPVRGLSEGVDNMVAEARAGDRSPVFSRVQVFANRTALRLHRHYVQCAGEQCLVVFRVAAGTEVNVSNVTVSVTAPGTTQWVPGYNSEFRTLPSGLLWLYWKPGALPARLDAQIEGLAETKVSIPVPEL